VKAALFVLGGLGVIVFVVVRQRRSDRFEQRSLLFPVALGGYGGFVLYGTSRHHTLTFVSAALLTASAVASIVFGVLRGRTMELFTRGDELWQRASWTTIVAGWGGLLVTRLVLIGIAAAVGATLAASPTSIPLMLGITLATQTVVVGRRARDTGLAIAPSRRTRRRSRRRGRHPI
jgi:uncharacterized protein YacL